MISLPVAPEETLTAPALFRFACDLGQRSPVAGVLESHAIQVQVRERRARRPATPPTGTVVRTGRPLCWDARAHRWRGRRRQLRPSSTDLLHQQVLREPGVVVRSIVHGLRTLAL